MKVKKYDGSPEREIVTAMITHSSVLGRIADKWEKGGMFESDWSNIVGELCVTHYRSYGKAPGKAIQSLWEDHVEQVSDEPTIDLLNRFLSQLSADYSRSKKDVNPEYVLDRAFAYLNKVRIRRLAENLLSNAEANNIDKALKKLNSFAHLELSSGGKVDIFDDSLVDSTFASKAEQLIEFEGAFGNFVNDMMRREEFIAIMAPEKTGKTWWMMEFAMAALQQGRRVAFFEVGDMSTEQLMLRLYQRFTNHPEKPQLVKFPTFMEPSDENKRQYITQFEEKEYTEPLTMEAVKKRMAKLRKKMEEHGPDRFRLSVHPNSSITVSGLDQILTTWKRESGWQPDVVVIDYADILAPPNGIQETRDQINSTWKHLRRLNQKWHCLLITATQTDAASYSTHVLTRKNFSEDKRKFAHVTGMLGLNVNEEDKENQITRINWVLLRSRRFSETKVVHVAGCLDVGRPLILSSF